MHECPATTQDFRSMGKSNTKNNHNALVPLITLDGSLSRVWEIKNEKTKLLNTQSTTEKRVFQSKDTLYTLIHMYIGCAGAFKYVR